MRWISFGALDADDDNKKTTKLLSCEYESASLKRKISEQKTS